MSIPKKIVLVIIGSLVSSFGMTAAIHAGFGSATLAVLWQGIAKCLHLTLGQTSFLVAIAMILFAFFYDRKQIYYGTILYQILYSSGVDFFVPFIKYSQSRVINFLIMIVGIVIFAVGTALYSYADFGRGSYEALHFSLVERNGWPVRRVRIVLDVACVVIGVILGGTFGACTIVTVCLSGTTIQFTLKMLKKWMPS